MFFGAGCQLTRSGLVSSDRHLSISLDGSFPHVWETVVDLAYVCMREVEAYAGISWGGKCRVLCGKVYGACRTVF